MPEELCDVFGAAMISGGTLPDGELSLRYGAGGRIYDTTDIVSTVGTDRNSPNLFGFFDHRNGVGLNERLGFGVKTTGAYIPSAKALRNNGDFGTYTLTKVRTESDSCLRRQTQPKSGATTNAPPSGCATSDRHPPRAHTAIAE